MRMQSHSKAMHLLLDFAEEHHTGGIWFYSKADASYLQMIPCVEETGNRGGLVVSYPLNEEVELIVELGQTGPHQGAVRDALWELLPELRRLHA